MEYTMFVSGTEVRIYEAERGWAVVVGGAYWGQYQTLDVAVKAAYIVLSASRKAA